MSDKITITLVSILIAGFLITVKLTQPAKQYQKERLEMEQEINTAYVNILNLTSNQANLTRALISFQDRMNQRDKFNMFMFERIVTNQNLIVKKLGL